MTTAFTLLSPSTAPAPCLTPLDLPASLTMFANLTLFSPAIPIDRTLTSPCLDLRSLMHSLAPFPHSGDASSSVISPPLTRTYLGESLLPLISKASKPASLRAVAAYPPVFAYAIVRVKGDLNTIVNLFASGTGVPVTGPV